MFDAAYTGSVLITADTLFELTYAILVHSFTRCMMDNNTALHSNTCTCI